MDDNNLEGWVSGEFSEEAVRLAERVKVERAELNALPPRKAMIEAREFKRMLDRGIMRVKIDGLIKAAQYNGLEGRVKNVLSHSERRVSVILDGFESKEISIKFENACVLSCVFCQKITLAAIPSGCGCKGSLEDVQDCCAGVAHICCRANFCFEAAPQLAGIHEDSKFDLCEIQRLWSQCPKCKQTFTGAMRVGLAEVWWSQVCDHVKKDPDGYIGAAMNLTVCLANMQEDAERREQYQQMLRKVCCFTSPGCTMEAASTAESMFNTALFVLAEHDVQIDPAASKIVCKDILELYKNFVKEERVKQDQVFEQDLNKRLGKDATPSQLRSLIMSRGTDQMWSPGSKSRVISAKDVMTVGQIMVLLDKAVAGKAKTIGEALWELALKIRIQASDALEAVGAGCIPKMVAILSAQPRGGWSKTAKCSDSSTFAELKIPPRTKGSGVIPDGDHFFDSLRHAELAASVLHEICRYRSGEEQNKTCCISYRLTG
jgi:hypothetical protein